ncbi:hypothetical protein KIW84_056012 [Lathyrus oleraceus]|uniref:Uncharacterized protein n=1 Tax=Pisum sativum TaxID=3888 RepID=A0A9D5AKI4_PEA|nr:hypothetical protein KIW84_056012 [Pisum sativum]
MTNCRLQARNFITQDGVNGTRRMKRSANATLLNVASSTRSVNDSFKQLSAMEASDLESTATSNIKKPRIEANHALLEEIRDVNQRLIDTVVSISDEEVDPSAAAPAQSLAIGTPGISASPLLAEFTGPDGAHGNALAPPSGKSTIIEQPIDRLIKAASSLTPAALRAVVSDIDLLQISEKRLEDALVDSSSLSGLETHLSEVHKFSVATDVVMTFTRAQFEGHVEELTEKLHSACRKVDVLCENNLDV